MVTNWDRLEAIRLTESAQKIKSKNANANPSGGSKIKDLTYEDIAAMQMKIKEEMERKQKKKAHIPLN